MLAPRSASRQEYLPKAPKKDGSAGLGYLQPIQGGLAMTVEACHTTWDHYATRNTSKAELSLCSLCIPTPGDASQLVTWTWLGGCSWASKKTEREHTIKKHTCVCTYFMCGNICVHLYIYIYMYQCRLSICLLLLICLKSLAVAISWPLLTLRVPRSSCVVPAVSRSAMYQSCVAEVKQRSDNVPGFCIGIPGFQGWWSCINASSINFHPDSTFKSCRKPYGLQNTSMLMLCTFTAHNLRWWCSKFQAALTSPA